MDQLATALHVDINEETGAVFLKPIPGQIVCELDPIPERDAYARRMVAAYNATRHIAVEQLEAPLFRNCLIRLSTEFVLGAARNDPPDQRSP